MIKKDIETLDKINYGGIMFEQGRKEREAEICLIVYNIIMMYPLLMGAKLIGKIKRQIKEKKE